MRAWNWLKSTTIPTKEKPQGTARLELLEGRLLFSADLIGVEPLNLTGTTVAASAVVVDLDQQDPPSQESDSSAIMLYAASAPAPATDLHIVADTGSSAADGVTNRLSFTLAGQVSASDLSVTLWDLTAGSDLGSAAVSGTDFSANLTFTTAGLHEIRVRTTDGDGLYSDSVLNVTIDQTGPAVESVLALSPGASGAEGFSVQFSEDTNVPDLIADGSIYSVVTLSQISGGGDVAVDLSGGSFTYDQASRVLQWQAGAGSSLPVGSYRLTLLSGRFLDLAGNSMSGGGQALQLGTEQHAQANGADIDVGDYSVPSLADWNSDGLDDLLIGEKFDSSSGKVRVYLNSGTLAAPVYTSFTYVQAAGSDLVVPATGCLGAYPRFHDWNQDGVKDLLVGLADGTIRLYLNSGTAASPMFGASSLLQAGVAGAKTDIDVGSRAAFDIADWNNDGTDDLVVGALDGKVYLYLNSQAAGTPDLASAVLVQEGTADLVVASARSSVAVCDFNGDGRKDLLLGNTNAQLILYRNIGTDPAPQFDGHQTILAVTGGSRTRPFVADFNADGTLDVLLGNVDGLVRYYICTAIDTNFQAQFQVEAGTSGTVGNTTVFPNISAVNNRRAVPVTMSQAGSIQSLSIYHQGGTGQAILAVYSNASGLPGSQLGVTASTAINSSEGWQTFSLQSPVAVASGQTVWLAWVFESDPGMRWTEGTPGRAMSTAAWSGGMPAGFGAATVSTGLYSIYATYTTQGDITAPGDVTGLAATPGDGQVGLSWTNPGDADLAGVKALRKTGSYPGTPTDGTVVYSGLATSCTDTGLTNGTMYYYRVFTYDGVPNYSAGATTTGLPVESSTTGVVGNTTVFPNISAVVNRRAIPVTMSQAGTIQSVSIYHQGGTGQAILAVYSDASGLPGSQLGVTASTAINSSEGWQTFALQSPVAVSSGQTVWLAWVFEDDPGMRWTEGTPGRAMSTAAWSGGMPASFGAAAVSTGLYSIYATYVASGSDVTAPGDVTGLTATPGDEQVGLSWTNPGDADLAGVKVLRKTGSYPGTPTDGTVVYSGLATSCTDTGLTNGTTYYYKVFSYDEVPNYSGGAAIAGTPVASSTEGTVGNTTVFPNISAVNNRRAAPVTMSQAGSIQSVSIYHQGGTGQAILAVYSDASGLPGSQLGVTASAAINSSEGWQTFALQSPVAVSSGETIWLAWVFENDPGMRWTEGTPGRASSTATWSGGMPASFGAATIYSSIYSIYATYVTSGSDVTAPGDVTGLAATPGDGQVGLSWTNPGDTDLAGVKVLRKTGSYPNTPTDGTVVYAGLATSCTDTGLTNGTTYYYKVFSYDEVPNYSGGAAIAGTPVASPVAVEVTVDNTDSGASSTGVWYVSARSGCWGTNSMATTGEGSTFTWTADLTAGAMYAVYAWWTAGPLRYTTVPYEIRNGGTLVDTVIINQTVNGGQWNLLGVYSFSGPASVTVSADPNSTASVCADAVRFTPVTPQNLEITGPTSVNENSAAEYDAVAYYSGGASMAVEPQTWGVDVAQASISATGQLTTGAVSADTAAVVSAQYTFGGTTVSDTLNITIVDNAVTATEVTVDNLDPGASWVGGWYQSSSPDPWSTNSMVTWTPGETFTFAANLVSGTAYKVYAWWAVWSCRYTAVPYEIRSGSTLLGTAYVDQTTGGGQWNLLGTYTFTGTATVTILSAPSDAYSTNADAVRFVPVIT